MLYSSLSNALNKTSHSHSKQIFSGIQPTSIPHIGNYFGAIKQWVDLQKSTTSSSSSSSNNSSNAKSDDNKKKQEQPMIISVVDLHAITLPIDPRILNDYIYKSAATLIACGIDPAKTILYQQSQVPYHGQLSWILGCKLTMPRLGQMHQFKFKSSGLAEAPLGLYVYPVLQAADILLFKGTHVPVGEDQVQHLELCRDIAAKFNNSYKVNFFPEPITIETGLTRLKSLRNPLKKMSKSDVDQQSRIELIDTPETIVKKIKKAVTDSHSSVTYEPEKRPGVSTLIDIHAACTDRDPDEIVEWCMLNAINTGIYKQEVADALIKHLKPIQDKYARLIKDKGFLRQILDENALKANQLAEANYKEVCKIIGMN